MPKKSITSEQVLAARKEEKRARHRKNYLLNREATIARVRAYNAGAGVEVMKKARKRWRDANRPKANSYERKRRARAAAVAWGDPKKIEAFYALAETMTQLMGEKYHVDHIYPLSGRSVCGLHVEANLRVITATANMRKGNRMPQVSKETC